MRPQLPPGWGRFLGPFQRQRSRASFRFPQWWSLRSGLNTRSMWRFNARMTPIRANIVGPPDSATRIKASIAACHSAASCSAFGSRVMNLPASSSVTIWRPRGSGIGSSNRRGQPVSSSRRSDDEFAARNTLVGAIRDGLRPGKDSKFRHEVVSVAAGHGEAAIERHLPH